MTPTPRDLASQAFHSWCSGWGNDTIVDHIERAITSAISDQTAALRAALEDLAKAKQQAHDNHVQIGHASSALNRVLLHVTGCSAGEFDTYMETAERIIEHLKDDALHLKETSDAFVQTTNELMAAQAELAKAKRERDEFALALTYRCPVCGGDGAVTGCGPNDEPVLYECAQCAPAYRHIAAHDRAVAARVLRETDTHLYYLVDSEVLREFAAQYERGEREVPGE